MVELLLGKNNNVHGYCTIINYSTVVFITLSANLHALRRTIW